MHDTGKPMTWTRWAVKIDSQHPPGTYAMLEQFFVDSNRFKTIAMGVTESQVRLIVEYTAAGANSDDIKRRFTAHGIPRENVETIKVACVETEWAFNADLVQVVEATAGEVVGQVAVDVTSAMQQVAPDEALQVMWAVSMIDMYNDPIIEGSTLINAHEHFAATVA